MLVLITQRSEVQILPPQLKPLARAFSLLGSGHIIEKFRCSVNRKSKPSTPATHKRIPIPGCEAGLCSGLLRSRDVRAYALTMLWTVDLESWSWAAMARTLRPSLWSLRLPVHNHLRPAELLALLPCPRNTSSPIFSMCNFS